MLNPFYTFYYLIIYASYTSALCEEVRTINISSHSFMKSKLLKITLPPHRLKLKFYYLFEERLGHVLTSFSEMYRFRFNTVHQRWPSLNLMRRYYCGLLKYHGFYVYTASPVIPIISLLYLLHWVWLRQS